MASTVGSAIVQKSGEQQTLYSTSTVSPAPTVSVVSNNSGTFVTWGQGPSVTQIDQGAALTDAGTLWCLDTIINPQGTSALATLGFGNVVTADARSIGGGDYVIEWFADGSSGYKTGSITEHGPVYGVSVTAGNSVNADGFSPDIVIAYVGGNQVSLVTFDGAARSHGQITATSHVAVTWPTAVSWGEPTQIVHLANGNFALSYIQTDIEQPHSALALLSPSGSVIGGARSNGDFLWPTAALPDGNVATIEGNFFFSNPGSEELRIYSGTDFSLLHTSEITPLVTPQITALPNNEILVSWRNSLGEIDAQLYSSTASKIGSVFTLIGSTPGTLESYSAAATANGNLEVVWDNTTSNGASTVYSQLFHLTGFQTASLVVQSFGTEASAGGWPSQNQDPRTVADVNGDGNADIIGFGSAGVYVSLAGSDGSYGLPNIGLAAFGTDAAAGGWVSNDQDPRMLADVNGDGKADIVGFGGSGVYVSLAATNGQFYSASMAIASFGTEAAAGDWASNNQDPRMLADVNGDGKADIVGFGGSGVYVSLATSNGQFASPFTAIASFGTEAAAGGWVDNNTNPREMGDVNGDGHADIVGFGGSGVYVALGTGDGHFSSPSLTLASFGTDTVAGGWSSQDALPRMLGDVNGDARADIVGFGGSGTYVAFGQADGTFSSPVPDIALFAQASAAGGWMSTNTLPRMLADMNGDGKADIVGFGGSGVYVSQSSFTG